MNNERRLNMSEEEARKRMRELLNLPKEDLLTQYLFLQQENQELKEIIDKAIQELSNIDGDLSNGQLSDRICNLIDVLKEMK